MTIRTGRAAFGEFVRWVKANIDVDKDFVEYYKDLQLWIGPRENFFLVNQMLVVQFPEVVDTGMRFGVSDATTQTSETRRTLFRMKRARATAAAQIAGTAVAGEK